MTLDTLKAAFNAAKPFLVAVTTAVGAAGFVLSQGGSAQSAVGAAFISFSTIYLEILRRRGDDATAAAKDAKNVAADTKQLINGRMDDLLRESIAKAYAEGHAAGVAKVSDAVARSPKVSLDAQGVAGAIAAATKPASPAPAG